MNQTHKDIKLNPTYENSGQINVLDLLLILKPTKMGIAVFRKPNTIDTTISFFSNHSVEHKIVAFRYHITRMHSLPLTSERKQKEWTIIKYIAQNNNFLHTLNQNLTPNYNADTTTTTETLPETTKKTWTTFAYFSPLVRKITNLFKYTNVGISCKSTNTIQHLTKPKTTNNIQKQKICGM